jgi:hypothetical protein
VEDSENCVLAAASLGTGAGGVVVMSESMRPPQGLSICADAGEGWDIELGGVAGTASTTLATALGLFAFAQSI